MIELPPLPVPIEEMYFFATRRKDGVVEIYGAYSQALDAGLGKLMVGAYPDHRSASSALDEIGRPQTLTRNLMR